MALPIFVTGGKGRLATTLFRAGFLWDSEELILVEKFEREDCITFEEMLVSPRLATASVIYHLAWSSVPSTAQENPDLAKEDLRCLQQLLEKLKRSEQPPRLVFFSSGSVYGNAAHPEGSLETDEANPECGAYAQSKIDGEKLIKDSGLPHVILRISNAYGAGGPYAKQGVIPVLIEKIANGEIFERWGENTMKDYLHVDDIAQALRAVLDHEELNGIYNLASGDPRRLNDVIAEVEKAMGSSIETKQGGVSDWDVIDNRLCARKMFEATKWKAQVKFEDGVKRLADEWKAAQPG